MTIDEFLDSMVSDLMRRFPDADVVICTVHGRPADRELNSRTTMSDEDALDLAKQVFDSDASNVVADDFVICSAGRLH